MGRDKLRKRAEAAILKGAAELQQQPMYDLQRLVHELQVHQIELEMQNEELRAAQLLAETARAQYGELFQAAPTGYLTIDAEGAIADCNQAAIRMLGAPRHKLLQRRFAAFVAQPDLMRLVAHLQCAREQKHAVCEVHLQPVDGRAFMARLDTSTIPSSQHDCLVVLTDMSERQREQELLEGMNQELERRVAARTIEIEAQNRRLQGEVQARTLAETQRTELESRLREAERLQSLGMLSAGIAHDFNNLLVSVVGNAEMLLRATNIPDGWREPLDMIWRTGQDASELTRQLLVFAGQGRMETTAVNMTDIISECVERVRPRLAASVRIAARLNGGRVPVAGDRTQLQRVVLNLLTNATEALEGQGEIEIGTHVRHLDDAALSEFQHASAAKPGAFVILHVADTGRGIDAASLMRIFEPFFSTKFTGRGLGLASVLGIVQSHAGAIRVTSRAGHGTRFELAFPQSDAQRAPVRASMPKERWKASGSVLLIDDDDDVRRVVSQMLRVLGFEVAAADGGEAGLKLLDGKTPAFNLVVLDWLMPKMSGEAVLRELRQRDPGLPVILMSGYSADAVGGDDRHALRVQKPMTFAHLEAAVRKALSAATCM